VPARPSLPSVPTPPLALVKSKDRVKDLAEVYTPGDVVESMLDLVARQSLCTSQADVTRDPTARFLEPACGNGNFLEAILNRKLSSVSKGRLRQDRFEFLTLLSVASVYGIDIDQENVDQSRERLRNVVLSHYSKSRRGSAWRHSPGFDEVLDHVLRSNIVRGDTLNEAHGIVLVEYSVPRPRRQFPLHIAQAHYTLAALLQANQGPDTLPFQPVPVRTYEPTHYLLLQSAQPISGRHR
jgi:hypothetical protein